MGAAGGAAQDGTANCVIAGPMLSRRGNPLAWAERRSSTKSHRVKSSPAGNVAARTPLFNEVARALRIARFCNDRRLSTADGLGRVRENEIKDASRPARAGANG